MQGHTRDFPSAFRLLICVFPFIGHAVLARPLEAPVITARVGTVPGVEDEQDDDGDWAHATQAGLEGSARNVPHTDREGFGRLGGKALGPTTAFVDMVARSPGHSYSSSYSSDSDDSSYWTISSSSLASSATEVYSPAPSAVHVTSRPSEPTTTIDGRPMTTVDDTPESSGTVLTSDDDDGKNGKLRIVVGAVIALAVASVIVLVILLLMRRRRRPKRSSRKDSDVIPWPKLRHRSSEVPLIEKDSDGQSEPSRRSTASTVHSWLSTTDHSEGGATTTSGGVVSISDASTQYQGFWVGRLSEDSHESDPRVGAYSLLQRASQGAPTLTVHELGPSSASSSSGIGPLARDLPYENAPMLPPPAKTAPPASPQVRGIAASQRFSNHVVSPFADPDGSAQEEGRRKSAAFNGTDDSSRTHTPDFGPTLRPTSESSYSFDLPPRYSQDSSQ